MDKTLPSNNYRDELQYNKIYTVQSMSLFQLAPIEKTIINHKIVEYRAPDAIFERSTIEFYVPETTTDYINVTKFKFNVE